MKTASQDNSPVVVNGVLYMSFSDYVSGKVIAFHLPGKMFPE
jgi:hypothetical protein